MKKIHSRMLMIMIILLTSSPACLGGGDEPTEETAVEDVIATSVEATLAAAQLSWDESPPPAASTISPTITASLPPVSFSGLEVSFDFDPALAENITAGISPGIQGEGLPWWTPIHREFRFIDWTLPETFHQPVIRIYPADEFRAMNEMIGPRLDALEEGFVTKDLKHQGLMVPDIFNAGQLYQSNIKFLDFQNGQGARWLSQYGQAYFPIGWPRLFYTFQGVTDDGKYYVSVIFPVTHPVLPDPQEVELNDAFAQNYETTYRPGIASQLEAEKDSSFFPSLRLLDDLVMSLLVGEQQP